MESIIRCENISKSFPDFRDKSKTMQVLNDITFEVHDGEFLVLLGPGQCGKTTLLNIMAGHEAATEGKAYEREKLITGPEPSGGMSYQDSRLFPWLTVFDNVAFGPAVRKENKKEYRKRAQEFIDLVGLSGFEKTYPVKLSGGMKQRVGIARAYCNQPDIIMMDEPFSALDAQTRYMMQEELAKLCQMKQSTILFVTNNIEEAIYLADHIIVFSRCPARIKAEYKIDLPKPRDLTDPKFLALRKEITQQIDVDM